MKRSISLRDHFSSFTLGKAGLFGGTKAQWRSSSGQSAPAFSHCTNFARSAVLSTRLESGGGMRSSGSLLVSRFNISPSVNTPAFMAVARSSRRSFALRALESGPWQL